MPAKKYFTVREVSQELGIARDAVLYHLRYSNVMPENRDPRGRVLFVKKDIEALRRIVDERKGAKERAKFSSEHLKKLRMSRNEDGERP